VKQSLEKGKEESENWNHKGKELEINGKDEERQMVREMDEGRVECSRHSNFSENT